MRSKLMMNFVLIADELRRFFTLLLQRRHSWRTKQKEAGWKAIGRDIMRSTESLKGQIKDKAESLATGAQAWKGSSVTKLVPFYEVLISLNLKYNVLCESWALTNWQNCEIKTVRGAERSRDGGNPKVLLFCIKIGKLEGMGDFFPGKTCEPVVVRGTISFYNNKLQILPVGEGAMWNVHVIS